jgi:serine/threonine-protein kinase
MLREQLKKRGYRVLITNAPDRAIERFENEIRIADCAVFSAQDLGATAVQAFNQLGKSEITHDLPAVLLVDQRQKELAGAAETNDHRLMLPMPLKIKNLLQTLAKLLRKKP